MTEVILHGYLAKKYGRDHRFEVTSAAEACRALQANYKTFFADIRPGQFAIIRGSRKTGEQLTIEQVSMHMGNKPIHIVPVPRGGSSKGIIAIVLGVALIAVSILTMNPELGFMANMAAAMPTVTFLSHGAVLMMGAAMTLGGISQLITPTPEVNDYTSREQKKVSFLFSGAVNRQEQGGAVPILYGGPMEVGSVVVSGGISVDGSASPPPSDQAWKITVTAAKGISVNPSGVFYVMKGDSASFKITSKFPYTIGVLKINGTSVGVKKKYTISSVTSDTTVEAFSVLNPFASL